jgi:hypothetical protein
LNVSKKKDDPHITNKRIRHTYFWNVKRQRDGQNNFWMINDETAYKKNQLYQDNRIETFRHIYVQIKMRVGKPRWHTGARFWGSETGGTDTDRNTSLYRVT